MGKQSLGRGLAELLGGGDVAAAEAAAGAAVWKGQLASATVAIENLKPNPNQPRRNFEPQALRELTASIREHGILQPILVTADGERGKFRIVAGERRWRAAAAAKLTEVAVVILDKPNRDTARLASLVENLQRQDLNPIEEAVGYEALIKSSAYTHEQVARKVGKSRSYVTNILRLLDLPEGVRRDVELGALPSATGRLLVGKENALGLAGQIKKNKLNVRQAEKLVAAAKSPRAEVPPRFAQWERLVSDALGMKVKISGDDKGRFVIYYQGGEQLETLVETLSHPLKK